MRKRWRFMCSASQLVIELYLSRTAPLHAWAKWELL